MTMFDTKRSASDEVPEARILQVKYYNQETERIDGIVIEAHTIRALNEMLVFELIEMTDRGPAIKLVRMLADVCDVEDVTPDVSTIIH
jgi:hypothetical protein